MTREMLPLLPANSTALQRTALSGSGVLDELDLLIGDMQREGDTEAADEIAIARAKVFEVLASRIRPAGEWAAERETQGMEQGR